MNDFQHFEELWILLLEELMPPLDPTDKQQLVLDCNGQNVGVEWKRIYFESLWALKMSVSASSKWSHMLLVFYSGIPEVFVFP